MTGQRVNRRGEERSSQGKNDGGVEGKRIVHRRDNAAEAEEKELKTEIECYHNN